MRHLAFFLREAAANIARGGVLTAAAVLAMTFAALIVGIFSLAYYNLLSIYNDAKQEFYVDVYLKEEVKGKRMEVVGEHLRRLTGVSSAEFISSEKAADEFFGLFPEDKQLLEEMGGNPLPASYRVHLTPEAATPSNIKILVKKISALEGVDDAIYGQEWLEGLERAAKTMGVVGAAAAVVLGAMAILVVMSTIGLTVYARRDMISVIKIVGATDWFVETPFLVEGGLIGLLGGGLALAALGGGVAFLNSYGVEVKMLPGSWYVGGLLAAAFAGATGSFISVRRFLDV